MASSDTEEKRALVRRLISEETSRLRRRDLALLSVAAILAVIASGQAGYQYGLSSSQEAGLARRALAMAEKSNGSFNQAAQYAVQCAHAFSVINNKQPTTPATNRRRELPYLTQESPVVVSGIGPVDEAPKKVETKP